MTVSETSGGASSPAPSNLVAATEWPNYFPEGTPPRDAVDLSDTLFRLVEAIPPTKKDFIPEGIRNPSRVKAENRADWFGLSTFRTLDATVRTRLRYPEMFRTARIALAALVAADGKKRVGHSDHVTIWLRSACDPCTRFTVDGEAVPNP